jgi:Xaa-Pro aminopeptidase
LPHYHPNTVRADAGELVLIDWGAEVDRYKSDLTRVLPTRKISPKFAQVFAAVQQAQSRAIAIMRPGVLAKEVDADARAALDAAGFGPFFCHGLGHGFGLDIHEIPFLRGGNEMALQPGMVITVEPGVYLEGWGGIRLEDDVLITDEGCEVLTNLPKDWDPLW